MTSTKSGARAILLLPVFALAVSLAACAPAASPTPSATPTRAGAHTAAPKPRTNTAPAQTFGGDCDSILSTASVSAAVGATVALDAATLTGPIDYAVPSVGGTECDWSDPAGKGVQQLSLFTLPASLFQAGDKAMDCSTGSGAATCYFNAVDSGYWFSGYLVSGGNVSAATAQAAATGLETRLAAAAKSAGAVPSPTPIAGAWTKPASCEALGTTAGIVAASGSPTLQPDSLDTESDMADGYYAALAGSNYLGCTFSAIGAVAPGKLQGFTVELAPGGAWAKPRIAADGDGVTVARVAIPGADTAYTLTDTTQTPSLGITYIEVFDGVNWVAFEPYGGPITVSQLDPVITAILASL